MLWSFANAFAINNSHNTATAVLFAVLADAAAHASGWLADHGSFFMNHDTNGDPGDVFLATIEDLFGGSSRQGQPLISRRTSSLKDLIWAYEEDKQEKKVEDDDNA